ncbi:MAG: alkaline phosphatase [Lentisphaeria bacterium]|nr:alkaline phosphatase [Lentisphaeria bacterium]
MKSVCRFFVMFFWTVGLLTLCSCSGFSQKEPEQKKIPVEPAVLKQQKVEKKVEPEKNVQQEKKIPAVKPVEKPLQPPKPAVKPAEKPQPPQKPAVKPVAKPVVKTTEKNPKYVFYFIGDGMGKNHIRMARCYYGKLNLDSFPVRASVITANASRTTTDSAASGTALACGVKTTNGSIGMDASGKPVDSVAILAKRQGKKVALLTTVGVNNATPAAFYAHVKHREEVQQIIQQFPDTGIDILCGYGMDVHRKHSAADYLSGKAYELPTTAATTTAAVPAATQKNTRVRVINQDESEFFRLRQLTVPVLVYFNFGYEIERKKQSVRPLSAYVSKCIDLLKNHPDGFFLMAEGGKIDHAAHGNDGASMLYELKEFDNAIGIALEFYRKYPAETLIVVTADHNTGGPVFTGNIPPHYLKVNGGLDHAYGIGKGHTLPMIRKNLCQRGWNLTEEEVQALQIADVRASRGKNRESHLNRAIRHIIDLRCGIFWSTRSHTGEDVDLFAIGCMSGKFTGRMENSEVGRKMKSLYQKGK